MGGRETLLATPTRGGAVVAGMPAGQAQLGVRLGAGPHPAMLVLGPRGAMTNTAQLEPADKQTQHGGEQKAAGDGVC